MAPNITTCHFTSSLLLCLLFIILLVICSNTSLLLSSKFNMPGDKSNSKVGDLPFKEFSNLLKKIRVFGHFEEDILLDLWRHVTVLNVETNGVLFQPGNIDDNIYVVQKGQLAIYINVNVTPTVTKKFLVKTVDEQDTVFSMLSVLDVLTSHPDNVKTVSACALKPSTVLKLWAPAFKDVFEKYPESWLRAVQLIALNLQHVTFDTLHSLLGLTQALLKMKITNYSERKITEKENTIKKELNNYDRAKSLDFATAEFSKLFELNNEETQTLIKNKIRVDSYPAGYVLTEEGSTDISLLYIILGSVDLMQKATDGVKVVLVSRAYIEEVIGSLAILTGEPSFYTFRAHKDTMVAMIKRDDLYSLMRAKPRIVLTLAHLLIRRISSFVRQIDFVLQYEALDPMQELYRQNDKPDAIFRVLSGRLRSEVTTKENAKEIVEEFTRSDVVGMIELLTERPRSSTVISVRSTEIAKLPEGLLNMITEKHHRVMARLLKLLGNFTYRQKESKYVTTAGQDVRHVANLNTIATLAASSDIPLLYFTLELWHALNSIKPTLRLSSEIVKKCLGEAALEKANAFRFLSYLSQQEEVYPIVLYQCDFTFTEWTRRCVCQADCILVVVNGRSTPNVSLIEQQLQSLPICAQKELVLLWPVSVKCPYKTNEWLKVREWISSHYHIRVPRWAYSFKTPQNLAQNFCFHLLKYEKSFVKPVDKFSQFARLARILIGCSIGLVFGGGGARGASHVGVLQAITELGMIPIDSIAGVSIGALIGGIYCMSYNSKPLDQPVEMSLVHDIARDWFMGMTSLPDKIWDLTYPASAMFTGANFNQSLQQVFHETQIEDLWIPYFTVTTDITSSKMRVHTKGTLWRYVRASMSIAGVLPPICCEKDGHLLVDGAYVNNLPANVMRSVGVMKVFAIDVGGQDDANLLNYGDALSGWSVLWNKWTPYSQPLKVLDMAEIQSRLAYVSCARVLEVVKKAPYCIYMRPPIEKYKTLDFGLFDEVCKIGYDYGKIECENWLKTGRLEFLMTGADEHDEEKRVHQQTNTFTDLAAIVSNVKYKRNTDEPEWYSSHSDVSDDVVLAELPSPSAHRSENVQSKTGDAPCTSPDAANEYLFQEFRDL